MYAVDSHATAGEHARVARGGLIAGRYEMISEAGTGNFARVFECRDTRTGRPVAVKLLKHGFERDADFESDVLTAIGKHDPTHSRGVVTLLERTTWNGHATLVFNLKGKSLRQLSKRGPLSRDTVASIAANVATALSFLHDSCRVVHTDLKPENILEDAENSSGQRWCLCDLGSASFYTAKLDSDLITTRPYRAPEVVLNRGWTFHADTWSFGCLLYELHTGRKLFDCQTDAEHLAAMQARLGPMPPHMVGRMMRQVPQNPTRRVLTLQEELAGEPELLSLILAMLRFEPSERVRCADVPKHRFFAGVSQSSSVPAKQVAAAAALTSPRATPAGGLLSPSRAAMATAAPLSTRLHTNQLYSAPLKSKEEMVSSLPHPSAFPRAAPSVIAQLRAGFTNRQQLLSPMFPF